MSRRQSRLARYLRYYHLVMMILWVILVIPTILWWKDAVVWVAIIGIYANFSSEFSSWHGAQTEEKQEETGGTGGPPCEHCGRGT